MQIPDAIRRCTAFVGYRIADGTEQFAGTAFLLADAIPPVASETNLSDSQSVPDDRRFWLVTAKHVLEEIRTHTAEDAALIRVNREEGASWLEIPLERWMPHPDETVDVTIAEVTNEFDETDALFFPRTMVVTDQLISRWNIGIGDDVVIAGLFKEHVNTTRNIPIVRLGVIAAMPEEPVRTSVGTREAYLVESRSIGGLSGSPAFLSFGYVRLNPATGQFRQLRKPQFGLLGLVHGHYDVNGPTAVDASSPGGGLSEERINSGIAIVVPGHQIEAAISHASGTATPPTTETTDGAIETATETTPEKEPPNIGEGTSDTRSTPSDS